MFQFSSLGPLDADFALKILITHIVGPHRIALRVEGLRQHGLNLSQNDRGQKGIWLDVF